MSDFRQLANHEQLHCLAQLADHAGRAFGLHVEQRSLLQYEKNAVYALTDRSGARYVLRVNADDGYTAAEQASELDWLQWLSVGGQPVPTPVRTLGGDHLFTANAHGTGPRTCVLFRWMSGDLPAADISEAHVERLGAATASLHAQSHAFIPPAGFTRPRYDGETTFGAAATLPPSQVVAARLLERLAKRLHRDLTEQLRAGGCLIHGDLHRDNILVDEDAIRFIDFGDCGWGHPLFDVASVLDSFRRRVVAPSDYARARAAFLRGYHPGGYGADLTPQLRLFKALRDAITLRFVLCSRNASVQSWADDRAKQLIRDIEGFLTGETERI